MRASGPGLDRLPAAGLVAGYQGVLQRHELGIGVLFSALLSCCCTTDKTSTRSFDTAHRRSRHYERRLDSYVNYVLNHDTLSSTTQYLESMGRLSVRRHRGEDR